MSSTARSPCRLGGSGRDRDRFATLKKILLTRSAWVRRNRTLPLRRVSRSCGRSAGGVDVWERGTRRDVAGRGRPNPLGLQLYGSGSREEQADQAAWGAVGVEL